MKKMKVCFNLIMLFLLSTNVLSQEISFEDLRSGQKIPKLKYTSYVS